MIVKTSFKKFINEEINKTNTNIALVLAVSDINTTKRARWVIELPYPQLTGNPFQNTKELIVTKFEIKTKNPFNIRYLPAVKTICLAVLDGNKNISLDGAKSRFAIYSTDLTKETLYWFYYQYVMHLGVEANGAPKDVKKAMAAITSSKSPYRIYLGQSDVLQKTIKQMLKKGNKKEVIKVLIQASSKFIIQMQKSNSINDYVCTISLKDILSNKEKIESFFNLENIQNLLTVLNYCVGIEDAEGFESISEFNKSIASFEQEEPEKEKETENKDFEIVYEPGTENKPEYKKMMEGVIKDSKYFEWFRNNQNKKGILRTNKIHNNLAFEGDWSGNWTDWENGNATIYFRGGHFEDGNFTGVMLGANFENGNFLGGVLAASSFKNGTFSGGTFKSGDWLDGTWKNGKWIEGNIYSKRFDVKIKSIHNPSNFAVLENNSSDAESLVRAAMIPKLGGLDVNKQKQSNEPSKNVDKNVVQGEK